MATSTKLIRRCFVVLGLLAFAGCATTDPTPEPVKVFAPGDELWIKNRERHYRTLGWSSLDARYQAEQDLERGRSTPVEQPHHGRRVVN